jgi:2-polyprenyl-3-methyl-5-hydroxy-6-metoxy-1,4-benzoquinol methylase
MNLLQLRKAFRSDLIRHPLLLIYQMGKVGSQTIEATLRNAHIPQKIVRLHIMSPHNIGMLGRRLGDNAMSEPAKESLRRQLNEATHLYHIMLARRIRAFVGTRRAKAQLIVGVRDPVGLMLASIFQNRSAFFSNLEGITAETVRELILKDPKVEPIRRRYMAESTAYVDNWFDVELKKVTGIDVYRQPFPHDRGYFIYENKAVRALVYRFENLDGLKPMLEDFLGLELPLLMHCNIGEEKSYAETYRKVKEQLRLPVEYLRSQYSTRLSQHFYTDTEREQLIQQWSSGARARFGKPPRTLDTSAAASQANAAVQRRAPFLVQESLLSHLASQNLDLKGKKVLEIGAGAGLHTCFFESLGCDVLTTDASEKNIQEIQRRYPHRKTAVLDLDRETDLARLGQFDVIYCYGTLHRLAKPADALKALGKISRELILLETCVTPGDQDELIVEGPSAPNGVVCRPTRSWVARMLRETWGHAYTPVAQPNLPDFETNWAAPAPRKLYRALFVGSKQALTNPRLADVLPAQTPIINQDWNQTFVDLGSKPDKIPDAERLVDYRKLTFQVAGLTQSTENPARRRLVEQVVQLGFVLISEQPGDGQGIEELVFFKFNP